MKMRAILNVCAALVLVSAHAPAAVTDKSTHELATAAGSTARVASPIHGVGAKQAGAGVLGWLARRWIVDRSDNICGLREATQLSSPAVVDFDALLEATTEMKKLEREGIDPTSPAGVQLKAQAADRVAEAAEDIRRANGHCSVWKAIRHKDGRTVTDVTALVLAKL